MGNKKDMSNLVIVNATALASSGALTILNQFLEHAMNDSRHEYLCFIHENVKKNSVNNVTIIPVKKQSFIQRVWWDLYGVNNYIKKNKLEPKKIISLQNTSVNSKYKQIIYLHQPIPFSDFKIKKEIQHVIFFMYKYLYPFFIFFRTKNTTFVVQTDWMKEALIAKRKIAKDRVYVIKPDIILPSNNLEYSDDGADNKSDAVFLYPATPLFYKNHMIILDAMRILKTEGILGNTKFQVTFKQSDNDELAIKIDKYDLINNVSFLGVISYEELFHKYSNADAIIFPSYLESFGLPLAEGAMLGKYIICSDLPYARDVLSNYSNVDYVIHDDAIKWALSIKEVILKKRNNTLSKSENSYIYFPKTSWADFFKLI
ncbi:TPA: glycosyltransferase [Citrobacter freundii]|nr:glycosyltransferase [Citrobacter freundii]HBN5498348.1 glycosyltransferase [Citrobacter freundii]HBU9123676.1 glycosyltransferase [Citrobacter freundii]